MWFHIGANVDQRTRVRGNDVCRFLGLKDLGDGKKITLASPDEANRAIMTF